MRVLQYLIPALVVFTSLFYWKHESDLSERLCAELSLPNQKTVRVGEGWYFAKSGMRNQAPEICLEGTCRSFLVDVFARLERKEEKIAKIIVGNFVCAIEAHNPSQYFPLRFFRRPLLVAKEFRVIEYEPSLNFIDRFNENYQKELPLITALVESVWKGTTQSFPDSFIQFYRRGGLSHVLAVSGTHVMILYYLFNKIFGLALYIVPHWFRKNRIWLVRTILLFVAAFTLWKFSPGNAPVRRSLFFLLTLGILNLKMWKADPVQLVCSGLALLLLYEPTLFLSESFWLSAAGAFFLSIRAKENFLKTYVWGILLIPLLMAPTVAFVFGQVSLSSPFLSLVFSPLWDIVLIPLGYLAPLLTACNAGRSILHLLERFLAFLSAFQQWIYPLVDKSQLVTFRPSALCVIMLSISLVLLSIIATHFRQKNA